MGSRTDFAGFDDWVEIFAGGEQTDSAGNTRTWSEQDLDSIIAHHDPQAPAPAVVGHPRTDAPAYGWVSALKREGLKLLAKFGQVEEQFAEMVRAGRFRNRSVALDPADDGGWRLRHVGWLGAVPPAVAGLKPVSFSGAPAHEYVMDEGYTPSVLARAIRRLREFLIEHFGVDAADRVAPDWEIDSLQDHAESLRAAPADGSEPDPLFSRTQEHQTMSGTQPQPQGQQPAGQQPNTFSQADLDAARAAARAEAEAEHQRLAASLQQRLDAERRERLAGEYRAAITEAIDGGRLTPAQAEGMLEFMLTLPEGDEDGFEFARGEGDRATQEQTSPLAWFRRFVAGLPKQVELGEHRAGAGGAPAGDADGIAQAAREYQRAQRDAGRVISVSQAVAHVTGRDK